MQKSICESKTQVDFERVHFDKKRLWGIFRGSFYIPTTLVEIKEAYENDFIDKFIPQFIRDAVADDNQKFVCVENPISLRQSTFCTDGEVICTKCRFISCRYGVYNDT